MGMLRLGIRVRVVDQGHAFCRTTTRIGMQSQVDHLHLSYHGKVYGLAFDWLIFAGVGPASLTASEPGQAASPCGPLQATPTPPISFGRGAWRMFWRILIFWYRVPIDGRRQCGTRHCLACAVCLRLCVVSERQPRIAAGNCGRRNSL